MVFKSIEELNYSVKESGPFVSIVASIPEDIQTSIKQHAMQKNISSLRNRANELGVLEPIIQKQGTDRIVVECPVFGIRNALLMCWDLLRLWSLDWFTNHSSPVRRCYKNIFA